MMTPILSLFQKWDALYQEGYDLSKSEKAVERDIVIMRRYERKIMALPTTCAADFAAKVIVFTSYGDFALQEDGTHDLIAEAKSLTSTEVRATISDPLLETINAYLDGLADFNANSPMDDDGANAYAAISYCPPLATLSQWTEPAKTREGALKALQIAIEDSGGVYGNEAADRMVKAAIGYLKGPSV